MNEEQIVIHRKYLEGKWGNQLYKGQPFTGFAIDEETEYRCETEYKNGKLDGLSTSYDKYRTVRSEENYKDGKLDGLSTLYDKYGKVRSEENYKDGKLDGLSIKRYENGKLEQKIYYKDGKEDGSYISWYENGKKELEEHYKNGELDGVCTQFYENGIKMFEAHYKNGKKDGLQRCWNEFGHRINKEDFKKGVSQYSPWKTLFEEAGGVFMVGFVLGMIIIGHFSDLTSLTFLPISMTHFIVLIPSCFFGGLGVMKMLITEPVVFKLLKYPLTQDFSIRNIIVRPIGNLDLWRSHKREIILITTVFIFTSFVVYMVAYMMVYAIVDYFK